MTIDITPLGNAIKRLEQCLELYDSAKAEKNLSLADIYRTAAIKAFEYTYEFSWRTLRRYFEEMEGSPPEYRTMAFAELIRAGSDHGLLLHEWKAWKEYRDKRNITSHTYNEEKAEDVFSHIPDFLKDACYLHEQLKVRLDKA